jgi:putative copper export protein
MKIVSEHYVGIVNFDHMWGVVSFIKHLLYGLLVVLAALNFEVLSPRMAKAAQSGNMAEASVWKKRLAISGLLAIATAIATLILSSMMRYL